MSSHYTAQICTSGHLITAYVEEYPGLLQPYCSLCGSSTMMTCKKCNTKIRGRLNSEYGSWGKYKVPAYCFSCGDPYPWTKSTLDATKEILLLSDELTPADVAAMEITYSDLLVDTPRTQVAALKFKALLKKAGKTTSDALYSVLVDIASEAVKKIVWPDKA